MKKQIVVVGLGRFGSSVCKELHSMGHEIMAIDTDPEKVNALREYAAFTVIADATDENQLKSLGVRNFEHAIVAIGDNLQASVLCTLMLKELGLPKVWVKARDLQHEKILHKVGADRVIQPEKEMGIRVAHHVDSDKIIDYIDLSHDYSIIELVASGKMANKTLIDLNIRKEFNCIVLAIKKEEDVNIAPAIDDMVEQDDVLIVMGHKNDLKRLEEKAL
ncbi:MULTISPECIES: TrkA family potassium uptake protein [Planococcus]|uniref:Potassium transporter Trk n=2 Tax=Planococcus TaxID=1372 RepID=A0ABM5WYK5_9BACL|nr:MULTISPECIES: TrkA family potassium uptake protein [Planococcus]ALS79448.1 potassium transporter Trk [Planococcus kocurii]AQU78583.1 potassium transporter Trk [Planococcus faecalis]KAA0957040.1 TrkA family potassium uptake protein [Planococcus sp. ANT_H30]MDJ0331448.1 TrkA family potassium uptake protein [Planococcus sp. S3-L1]OHX53230.1 potassium transporter Trk [Planococcus faecalis]